MTARKLSSTRVRTPTFAFIAALVAIALSASAASAAEPPFPPSCQGITPTQPFLPWSDPALYLLVPGGSFESAPPWTLSGGAKVVNGNETYNVNGATDSHSLSMPKGAVAKSPQVCVGLGHPTARLFTKVSGPPASRLKVELLYKSGNTQKTLTIASLAGTSSWQPTAVIPLQATLTALPRSVYSPVAFRFTAQGTNAKWQIDDVYVDPWRH
jgi:hypothetical protein